MLVSFGLGAGRLGSNDGQINFAQICGKACPFSPKSMALQ
jgi:hypothetical protein